MTGRGKTARILVAGVVLTMMACGSPQHTASEGQYKALSEPTTEQPVDAVERAILTRIEDLEPGRAVAIEGSSVTAEAAYYAASGRTCRNVLIRRDDTERVRLACRLDNAWAFVPDVLGPMAGGRSP